MADLALTKIFDKMPNGGTAIGDNFDDVAAAVNRGLQDTGWVSLTLSHATGYLRVRRRGSDVFVDGLLDTSETATLAASLVIANLPAGFLPDTKRFEHANTKQTDDVANYQINLGDTKISAIKVDTNIAKYGLTIHWYWTTSDDFPS